ncbi:MAG: hypothetical protein OEZ57_03540 [Nitrospirota bacterium]|nr:hypothetical protein [Nitrospirota bacterium]MDH5587764.1 hypothetical protein [Nitrospirota bacterium]MDH5773974.1 hypothetical protein [Nitrospirota bacterium]
MESLPELVGTVHIILGPYRGNPIALYMRQDGSICQISPRIYPWNRRVGIGDTPNRAAADFENKWKEAGLAEEMYTGPHWEAGIKPEKPKPPPKPAVAAEKPAPKPSPETSATEKSETSASSAAPSSAKADDPSLQDTPTP